MRSPLTFRKSFPFLVLTRGACLVAFLFAIGVLCLLYFMPRPPALPEVVAAAADEPPGAWAPRAAAGINQLVLRGPSYARGLETGHWTAPLVLERDAETERHIFRTIPRWLFRAAEPFAVAYFHGIAAAVEPETAREIYGIAKSAPRGFPAFGGGYARGIADQAAYEIEGRIGDRTDSAYDGTVVAVPTRRSWILGRNLDLGEMESADREKILKWVFPDEGNAFVSVTWAGMVGVTTGVNEKGVYVSFNAAGTEDRRRGGMPVTLVLLDVLRSANSAEDALAILRAADFFASGIVVVLDSRAGKLYRVEESPRTALALPVLAPSVIADHLVSPRFADDPVNRSRRDETSSRARQIRGEALLRALFPSGGLAVKSDEKAILGILRDKGEISGQALHLGNRNAIDPLVPAHSVVFNGDDRTLYVGKGPGASGEFLGFDLDASFRARTPVRKGALRADPRVAPEVFAAVRRLAGKTAAARREFARGKCESGATLVEEARALVEGIHEESSEYVAALGDREACRGDPVAARAAWARALMLHPATPAERRALQAKLK